jgi:soluble lytic murein transglycosylase-like protein
MRKLPLLVLVLLAMAGPARAEIALLANGTTMKVEVLRSDGATVYLTLKGGGEVGVPAPLLVGLVPDEVLEEVAPGAGGVEIRALAETAARRHGLDPDLVMAVAQAESGLQPTAVSRKGAQGLMQLMPATAASLGVSDPFDPAQNLDGGARHLGSLLQRYDGDLKRALAAYNAGEGAVAKHGGVPPYPETRSYLRTVLARYRKAP